MREENFCTSSHSRREFLILSGAGAAYLGMGAQVASAQFKDLSFDEEIKFYRTQANQLRNQIFDAAVPISSAQLIGFITEDYSQRRQLAGFLNRWPEEASAYASSPDRVYEQKRAFEFINEQAPEQLTPKAESISPISPSVVLPEKNEAAQNIETPEPTSIIVIDILLETLDLGFDRELFLKFLENTPEVQEEFENIVNARTTHDWQSVAETIDRLLNWLIFGGVLMKCFEAARKDLGENAFKRLVKKLAVSLGLRFVPFVGWAYMGGALLLAIKNNHHRF